MATAVLTLIAAVPATVAAVVGWMNRRDLRTPNGEKIGEQVENALNVSLANHGRLRTMANELDLKTPDELAAADEVAARSIRHLRDPQKHKHE